MTRPKHRDARTRRPLLLLLLLLLPTATVGAARAEENGTEAVASPPGEISFVGRNWFAKARGVFHEWRVVEANVDLDRIEASWVVVEVELDSVDTGIERRDEHLRTEDFFETSTWPVSRVRVHSPRPIAPDQSGAPDDEEAEGADDEASAGPRYAVQFDVDLHGVTRTIEGEVRLVGTTPVAWRGELVIDRTEFGVGPKANRWNPMSPGAEIPVRFRVELP